MEKEKKTKTNKKEAEIKKETKKNTTKKTQTKKTTTTKTNKQESKKSPTKTNKKETKENKRTTNEGTNLIKIILIVTGIMIFFYGLTTIVTNKADETKHKREATTNNAEIQYEEILIGTMLNHSGTYYVLIKEEKDTKLKEYESLITTIQNADDTPTIYSAELSNDFNKSYKSNKANYKAKEIEDFKVTGTTLVKISDHKVSSAYNSYDKIIDELNKQV